MRCGASFAIRWPNDEGPCLERTWQISWLDEPMRDRLAVGLAGLCLAAMFALALSTTAFVDPDLWHEMALFREALELGRLPLEDRFAYTPTVYPSVHHEWGTGAVLYAVAVTLGAPGVMAFKYLLTAGVCGACCYCARRRGASWAVILSLASVTILTGVIGFTTIRAQVFTLLFLATMLCFLDADRRGNRRWMLAWLPLFVLWLNLHAGFAVGAGLLALHALEQALRRERFWHLAGVGAAMFALVAVNPYGLEYYTYLAHGLTMKRPLITEWQPLWTIDPRMFRVFLVSLVLVAYPLSVLGWRRMPGLLVLAATAWFAARHTRHVSLYLVVWLCYMPGWVAATPLGELLDGVWRRQRRWVLSFSAVVGTLCLTQLVPAVPWEMRLPVTSADERQGLPVYPAGAVAYLDAARFEGNLMVPFVPGGYVMWKLHPRVKVSIDGRYEVAYLPGVLEENTDLYEAKSGWRLILEKYPTDAVLVPRWTPLAKELPGLPDWMRVYRDNAFEVYARLDCSLMPVDHGDAPIPGAFP